MAEVGLGCFIQRDEALSCVILKLDIMGMNKVIVIIPKL